MWGAAYDAPACLFDDGATRASLLNNGPGLEGVDDDKLSVCALAWADVFTFVASVMSKAVFTHEGRSMDHHVNINACSISHFRLMAPVIAAARRVRVESAPTMVDVCVELRAAHPNVAGLKHTDSLQLPVTYARVFVALVEYLLLVENACRSPST